MGRDYASELSGAFSRWEESGFQNLVDWVTKGNTVAYSGGLKSFAEKIQKPYLARQNIEKASTYGDVEMIQTQISQFDFDESTTLGQFNELIYQAERSKEIEIRLPKIQSINSLEKLKSQSGKIQFRRDEINDAIDDAIETYEKEIAPVKKAFKEAETVEERKEAQRELSDKAGKILGGIKSGEKRRVGLAFRSLF